MTTGSEWRAHVGRNWAKSWQQTDRSFLALTQHLLERIAERPGNAVLDIGCGAGELSLAVARNRHGARVVGVDVSVDLLDAARERGAQLPNLEFVEADAAGWSMDGFSPDLLVSRHGVMFFDDPVAAFANLHAQAADGARMVFSCFRSRAENRWAADIGSLFQVQPAADPYAAGPFAFADSAHVKAILGAAGWTDIAFEPFDFAYIAGMGDDPVEEGLQLFRRIGPAAPVLAGMDGNERMVAEDRIREWLDAQRCGDLVALGATAWIVTATRG